MRLKRIGGWVTASVKNNTNRNRTVLVFASLAIAILAAVLYLGSLNVRQFEQTVVSDTQKHLLTIAKTQAKHLEEMLCEIECDMEALAANPIIKSRIRNNVRGSEIAEGDYRPFQHVFLEKRHIVGAFYRIDSTGIVQARMPSAEGREGRDYSTKPGVKHVLENHTKHGEHIEESHGHISELFTTASGAYAMSVCVPVFEKEEFIGVLRTLVYSDRLGDIIGDIKVGEKGYAWIIDDGRVVSHPDAEQIGADFMAIRRGKLPGADWSELEDIVKRMRDGQEGVGSYHSTWWTEPNPRMMKKLTAFAPIEIGNEQWSVAVSMGYDEIAGPIARHTRNTLILGGLLILIFLAGGMALYRVQKKKDELEIIAASGAELESANRKLRTEIRERQQAEEALRERNKELNCLYEISRVVESSPESSVEEMLQRIVNILPGSWQYPEIAGAQITMDGNEWTTANWQPTQWRQSADIHVHGELSGAVQVCYLEERRELDEGPFLKEERDLIDVVAERLDRIIEGKQTEEVLRNSESKHRTLLENLPQNIFYKDTNSVYMAGNENFARELNITPDEFAGKTDFDFFPRELAEKYRADDKRIMQSGEIEDIEEEYIQDGQELLVHTVKTPIKDENGNVIGILGIFWDITEQKQAEEALQAAYERNEAVLRTSMDGFMIMRSDGSIVECNEALSEMAGYSQDELLAMKIGDLDVHPVPEKVAERMQQVMQAGAHRFETVIRCKDGTIVDLEVSTTLVDLGEDEFFVSFARDITETNKLWQELNQQLLRDALTGVYNRRYFNETIIQEIKRADRYKHHISFIMGDVDGLKAVNDNFGHLVGDQILQGIAGVLERSVRAADMVVRYGGDEFLVVMPETPEDEAQQAVSRIEQNLTDWLDEQVEIGALHSDILAQVGFSLGVASCQPGEEIAIEEVLTQADEAMYQVKQTKRQAPVQSA